MNSEFFCEHCDQGFSACADYVQHMSKKHVGQVSSKISRAAAKLAKITEYTCSNCFQVFSGVTAYVKHMAQNHSGDNPIADTRCSKYNSRARNNYRCNICDSTFLMYDTYHQHMTVAHTAINYKCSQCPESFPTHGGLQEHLATNHPGKECVPFWCKICGQGFQRKSPYFRHMREKHPNEVGSSGDASSSGAADTPVTSAPGTPTTSSTVVVMPVPSNSDASVSQPSKTTLSNSPAGTSIPVVVKAASAKPSALLPKTAGVSAGDPQKTSPKPTAFVIRTSTQQTQSTASLLGIKTEEGTAEPLPTPPPPPVASPPTTPKQPPPQNDAAEVTPVRCQVCYQAYSSRDAFLKHVSSVHRTFFNRVHKGGTEGEEGLAELSQEDSEESGTKEDAQETCSSEKGATPVAPVSTPQTAPPKASIERGLTEAAQLQLKSAVGSYNVVNGKARCTICQAEFSSIRNFFYHAFSEHGDGKVAGTADSNADLPKKADCKACGAVFICKETLNAHHKNGCKKAWIKRSDQCKKTRISSTTHRCQSSSKKKAVGEDSQPTTSGLVTVSAVQSKGPQPQVSCSLCHLTCESPSALSKHLLVVHAKIHEKKEVIGRSYGSKRQPVKRPLKPSSFSAPPVDSAPAKVSWYTVETASPVEGEQSQAPQEEDSSRRKRSRKNSAETDDSALSPDFVCSICEARFKYYNEFEYHMSLGHNDTTKVDKLDDIVCGHCYRTFKRKSAYYNHIREKHGGDLKMITQEELVRLRASQARSEQGDSQMKQEDIEERELQMFSRSSFRVVILRTFKRHLNDFATKGRSVDPAAGLWWSPHPTKRIKPMDYAFLLGFDPAPLQTHDRSAPLHPRDTAPPRSIPLKLMFSRSSFRVVIVRTFKRHLNDFATKGRSVDPAAGLWWSPHPTKRIKPMDYAFLIFPVATFGLGCWQVKRHYWKQDLIERMKTKMSGPAIPVPTATKE
ncbi:unnamed protein product [Cyprideis torosa]|uniref:Uncharacterized protein n=1 Tax=Cyprideis torosa TaxID=163714 RepID=A0A7R8W8W4_9CRUS|nr:unnamed protein product [Cyprideis torosa]CAG0883641.1 unnamed protein product [Cyprideis torosa]